MLKNRLLSGVAAIAMFAAASGATPAAARETFDWTGVYIGGHVGGGVADYDGGKDLVEASPIFVDDLDLDGFAGGGHVGVNDRFGSPLGEGHDFVVGIEGDATFTDWNATLLADVGDSTEAISGDVDLLASVRARLGVMYERGYGVPEDYDEAVKWDRLVQFGGSGGMGLFGSEAELPAFMQANMDCALPLPKAEVAASREPVCKKLVESPPTFPSPQEGCNALQDLQGWQDVYEAERGWMSKKVEKFDFTKKQLVALEKELKRDPESESKSELMQKTPNEVKMFLKNEIKLKEVERKKGEVLDEYKIDRKKFRDYEKKRNDCALKLTEDQLRQAVWDQTPMLVELQGSSAAMGEREQTLDVNWAKGIGCDTPPADIAEAVKTAINDAAWPPRVKLILSKIKIVWKPQDRASGLEFFNPTVSLPVAYDRALEALVIKPGFTKRTSDTTQKQLLAAQLDLLSFEMGKFIWDRLSVADQRRFSKKEFAGAIRAQGLDYLPNSRDAGIRRTGVRVLEKDNNAIFAFAYRHFVFDDGPELPRNLVEWWSNDPPYAVPEGLIAATHADCRADEFKPKGPSVKIKEPPPPAHDGTNPTGDPDVQKGIDKYKAGKYR